jgi:PAS domain-containing protein
MEKDLEKDEGNGGELSLGGPDHKIEEQILLSTVIRQTEDNVLITDSHRIILYVNPAFERSSGYLCSELKGKPMRYLRSDQQDSAANGAGLGSLRPSPRPGQTDPGFQQSGRAAAKTF